MSYVQNLVQGAMLHGKVLQARRAAQVQTVRLLSSGLPVLTQRLTPYVQVYSLICQRDNFVNNRMAKLTQKGSTDMRIIAPRYCSYLVLSLRQCPSVPSSSTSSQVMDFTTVVSWWKRLYCLPNFVVTALVVVIWYRI